MPRAGKKHPETRTTTRQTDKIQAVAEVEIKHKEEFVPAPSPPPPPAPPTATVLALEVQILDLVTGRSEMQRDLITLRARVRAAQLDFDAQEENLHLADQEVQYRMAVLAQLTGRLMPHQQMLVPQNFFGPSSHPADLRIQDVTAVGRDPIPGQVPYIAPGSIQGSMGSIPAARPIYPGDGSEVRSESAEEFRRSV